MSGNGIGLTELHQIAADLGGRCLTTGTDKAYVGIATFECGKNHVWRARTRSILAGAWCPKCAVSKPRLTLADMQRTAGERGGKCLSAAYVNSETKLEWECTHGHRWSTNAHTIRKGSWCPTCKHESQKNTIEDMRVLAATKGGKCISNSYVNNATPLTWQCGLGHRWKNQPSNITMGQWCPTCSIDNRRIDLSDLRKMAKEHGGKCLSRVCLGSHEKAVWECGQGHRWEAEPANVKSSGSWCPFCAGNQMKTIEEMKQLAASRGGVCLSKSYRNSREKLLWQCAEGHTWKTGATHVLRGQWCPSCAGVRKLTIELMRQEARKRGGRCLSDLYVNSSTKLQWRCARGHKWLATPKTVRTKGRWCPLCRQEDR